MPANKPSKGRGGGSQPRKTAKKSKKKTSSSAAPTTATRRRPTQQRSQRRFDSIVEAAAQQFARFGVSDTTMEGIAAEAGTSIGSVYQFFPNKRAVFREVALQCIALSRQNYTGLLGPDPFSLPWYALLDRFIDGFRRHHAEHVLVQAVMRNLEMYGEYAEEDEALLRELSTATGMLFAGWVPDFPAEHRETIATMLVDTVAMMLIVVTREPRPDKKDAMVRETKVMLRRYLAGYLTTLPIPDDYEGS
ncbi:MAG: TetR/AcrR family transcriptional regulator [Deltaproteobacteria bacterium]|nr:TetR/AcrR family transcriptional regulator [Deltaproteobacteria bacterium]